LNYEGDSIREIFKKILIGCKWNQQSIEALFARKGDIFNESPVLNIEREKLVLHDLSENVFAIMLKLK